MSRGDLLKDDTRSLIMRFVMAFEQCLYWTFQWKGIDYSVEDSRINGMIKRLQNLYSDWYLHGIRIVNLVLKCIDKRNKRKQKSHCIDLFEQTSFATARNRIALALLNHVKRYDQNKVKH